MRSSPRSRRRTRRLDAARAKPARRSRRAARALRVLVAEDNPTNQKLVSALLDQQGHHVSIVSNGRLAVERAAQEPFDIILMDVQMPEMSGLEATAAIREAERHTGRHIPIVALTARAMAGDREQCLAAGMDAYVSKPVRADELFSAIDAADSPERPHRSVPRRRRANNSQLGERVGAAGRFWRTRRSRRRSHRRVPHRRASHADPARQAGAGASNAGELAAAAHAIKGSAGLFSQGEAYDRARALEMRARSGDASNAAAACDEIDASLSRLVSELRTLRNTLQRP